MSSHRIYIASSWRNMNQPSIIALLRKVGHEVYDFRNTFPENTSFHWSEIDPAWGTWTVGEYRRALARVIVPLL